MSGCHLHENLELFLKQIKEKNCEIIAIQEGEKFYYLSQYKLFKLTPSKVLRIYKRIVKKFYNKKTNIPDSPWFENQLRIFVWIAVCYSYLRNKHLSMLKTEDWNFFADIFKFRSSDFLQFHGRSLIRHSDKKLVWVNAEVEMLNKIIESLPNQQELNLKWNDIAFQFFILSGKDYFRSSKQCRQQWHNHLNPNTIHSEWSIQQDQIIFNHIKHYGKKWALIAKTLKGRTDHMVKNRYKSIINSFNKRYQEDNQIQLIDIILKQMKQKTSRNCQLINFNDEDQSKTNESYIKSEDKFIHQSIFKIQDQYISIEDQNILKIQNEQDQRQFNIDKDGQSLIEIPWGQRKKIFNFFQTDPQINFTLIEQ